MQLAHALGLSRPFDPSFSFVSSPFFSVPVLAVIRLSLALYTLTTLLITIIWSSIKLHDANSYFSYFTHLSYIGLCAYFFAAGVQTMIYSWCPIRKRTLALRTWPRFLQFLHVWLYTTVVTFPIVVTVVFWAVLSGPSTFDNKFDTWSNISVHAFNTAFALFEIILTNVPRPPLIYLPLNVALLACYLGVAYITSGTLHFYTYEFLDPKREGPALAGYIVGIAVGECIVYALVYLAVVLRQKATRWDLREKQSGSGVESDEDKEAVRSAPPEETMEEWQQVSKPESFDRVPRAL